MSKIVPFGDNVVVEPIEEELTSESGIIIPDSASKEKPMTGKVVSVGPGKMMDNGERKNMEIQVGDTVLYSKYGPSEVKVDGKEYLIIAASDIYGKIEG